MFNIHAVCQHGIAGGVARSLADYALVGLLHELTELGFDINTLLAPLDVNLAGVIHPAFITEDNIGDNVVYV